MGRFALVQRLQRSCQASDSYGALLEPAMHVSGTLFVASCADRGLGQLVTKTAPAAPGHSAVGGWASVVPSY